MSTINYPETAIYMNWRPEDARHAFSIYDRGGPLVDAETGRVIVLAPLSAELWSQLVQLPEGATLEGMSRDAGGGLIQAAPEPDFAAAARAAWREAVAA